MPCYFSAYFNAVKGMDPREEFTRVALSLDTEALERVAVVLTGGWSASDLSFNASSRAGIEECLRTRAETRKHAMRLCCIAASVLGCPEAESLEADFSRADVGEASSKELGKWCDTSDIFRAHLSRSTVSTIPVHGTREHAYLLTCTVPSLRKVGAPCATLSHVGGKLEKWMARGLVAWNSEDWKVGEMALVWWGWKWHVGALLEIGGVGDGDTVKLRMRVPGHDTDLWVGQREWPFRLRPVFTVAPGAGRLAKGFCGREGDLVEVDLWDCAEHPFWRGNRRPVGVITKAHLQRDSVEVEFFSLGISEAVVIPNRLCRRPAPDMPASGSEWRGLEGVRRVRAEALRLSRALLAGATLGSEARLSPALRRSTAGLGMRVWHGMRVVCDHRVLVSVFKQDGQIADDSPISPPPQGATQVPVWRVRVYSPSVREWLVGVVPRGVLSGAAAVLGGTASWEADPASAAAMGSEVAARFRVRRGVLEWGGEHEHGDDGIGGGGGGGIDDDDASQGASFPATTGAAVQSVSGLALRGVGVRLTILRGAGCGDLADRLDGMRLVVTALPPAHVPAPPDLASGAGDLVEALSMSQSVLVVFKRDWQWLRPRGANAGLFPGLRWLTRKRAKHLMRCLANRLDTFDGAPVLRLPHRTVYPVGFVPFHAAPPPNDEAAWLGRSPQTDGPLVAWRAHVTLEERRAGAASGRMGGRWGVTVQARAATLVVDALRVDHASPPERLSVCLTVRDWGSLGFGPLPWLSRGQVALLCRRIVHPAMRCLFLETTGSSRRLVVNLRPVLAQSQPSASRGPADSDVLVTDAGASFEVSCRGGRRHVLVGRDLVACCPSVRVDPFAAEVRELNDTADRTANRTAYHEPLPGSGDGAACLGAVRFSGHGHRRRGRPGWTAAEAAADSADCASAWEEVRLASAVRDMEPLARVALARRILASLRPLDGPSDGSRDGPSEDGRAREQGQNALVLRLSCAPPMPSSLTALDRCDVRPTDQAGGHAAFVVTLAPPVPLCAGSGTVASCTLRFPTPPQGQGLDSAPPNAVVLEVLLPRRGSAHRLSLAAADLGPDLLRLWGVSPAGLPSSSEPLPLEEPLVRRLVGRLQARAGASARTAVREVAASARLVCWRLAEAPVPLFLRSVKATFVRARPVTVEAFDTGTGVLLVAHEHGGGFRDETMAAAVLEGLREVSNPSGCDDPGAAERRRHIAAATTAAATLAGRPKTSTGRGSPRDAPRNGLRDGPQDVGDETSVLRVEVPRVEFSGEPLLMAPSALDRLLLGTGAHGKWRERRRGWDRRGFLAAPLRKALGLAEGRTVQEVLPGLLQWAAPVGGGGPVLGHVVRVHPDGRADVAVGCDGTLLRRVEQKDLRCPLRPDKLLAPRADGAASFRPLRSNGYAAAVSADPHFGGFSSPLSGKADLAVGVPVQVLARYPLATGPESSSAKLQYSRGESEYLAHAGGDAFAGVERLGGRLAGLPEHLRLLLGRDGGYEQRVDDTALAALGDDGTATLDCSAAVSLHSKGGGSAASAAVSGQRGAPHPPSDGLDEALEQRRKLAAATNAFYQKQAGLLIDEGDAWAAKAKAIAAGVNAPALLAIGDDEDDEEPEETAARKAAAAILEGGETEAAARRRVIDHRAALHKAVDTYALAMRRCPEVPPQLFSKLCLAHLRLHEFDAALEMAREACKSFPHSARLCFWEGLAHMGLRRFQDAFGAFDRAVRLGRARGGKRTVDARLVDNYRRAAYEKAKKFVEFGDLIGDLETEAATETQRDIDRNLNVFNLYDSVPALTLPHALPAIEPASKLINPIANRLRRQPVGYGKMMLEREKAASEGAREADDSSSDDQSSVGGGGSVYAEMSSDSEGEADDEVLFELEVEVPGGAVLELTVLRDEDVAKAVDHFSAQHGVPRPHAKRLKADLLARAENIRAARAAIEGEGRAGTVARGALEAGAPLHRGL